VDADAAAVVSRVGRQRERPHRCSDLIGVADLFESGKVEQTRTGR